MKSFLKKIKSAFEIPFDPSDEKTNRDAVVSGLINIAIAVTAAYLIPFTLARGFSSVPVKIMLIVFFVFLAFRIAASKGHVNIISFALMLALWTTIVYIFLTFENGLRAPAYSAALAFIISYAGLLHGRRTVWVIAGISILVNTVIAIGELNGNFLVAPKIPDIRWALLGQVIFFSGIIFLLSNTLQNLKKSIILYRTEAKNRMEAEIAVGRLNEELEGRVQELEQFTYTVSHELKSPIVTIKNFLGSIEKDLHQKNYESAQKDFRRIVRATDKMHFTISDLLKLSRTGVVTNPYEKINIAELVQEALETVQGRIQTHHITINVASQFPSVYGDRMRLREVFTNLIDNAAKYSGDQSSPTIDIGAREGKEPVFFVRDNGMGIEPQYHAKIFGLFEKLDSTSEGTGVGLALIKRIVEAHDGRIWVESEGLGKGSTFCFAIPDLRK